MDKKKRAAAVLVVLLLAVSSYWAYHEYFVQDTSTIQATGTIEATTVELNSKMQGSIKTLAVEAGDTVAREQLIAELSRSDLVAQRERDALGVSKAEAQLADLISGAREQEKNEAAANVNIAKANFEMISKDFVRAETLYQEGAIPQAEFENIRSQMELNKNQLGAVEARLSLLDAGNRPQLINAARAELERSKAVLKATDAMLKDLKIYSPIDGVVLSKNYQEGEFVQMGASLATVANLEDLWIKVYIPTDDLPHIKLDKKVHFTVSGVDTVFDGVVEEINSEGEFTPKTIQTKKERTNVVFGVKIGINNEAGVLKPGMPADVTFGSRDVND